MSKKNLFDAVCTDVCVLLSLCLKGILVSLWLRYESVFQRGVIGKAVKEGGFVALAFCFNDCRSLLPLLPVIAL